MLKTIFPILLLLLFVGTSHAADENPIAAQTENPEQTLPVIPESPTTNQTIGIHQPNNDKLTDYRYCLELKSNIEVIRCRYKK